MLARRWLLWKASKRGKVPYYANGEPRAGGGCLDTEADYSRLVTVEEAFKAIADSRQKYDGIGFALGPDGTGNHWQGIDLDCVQENGLIEIAEALPGYVEYSPSGIGFHAIGYGPAFSTLGNNGTGIEAYTCKRYFTVTGKQIHSDTICDLSSFVSEKLAPLHKKKNRDCFTQRLQSAQRSQEDTGLHRTTQELSGEKGEGAVAQKKLCDFPIADLPESCRPTGSRQRHSILFNLARHLKTLYPDAKPTDAVPVVKAWHAEFLQVIATKDWAETWGDFSDAWGRVKYLEGQGTLDTLLAEVDQSEPPPDELSSIGYDEKMWAIVRLLDQMSAKSADRIFFIGNRTLAGLFGFSAPTAGKVLRLMIRDGIIELVDRGRIESREASTYRFIWK